MGNTLNLKNIEKGNYHLQISDLIGRIVYEKHIKLNKGSFSLDISEIPSGVYFLQLKQGNRIFVKRIIKK